MTLVSIVVPVLRDTRELAGLLDALGSSADTPVIVVQGSTPDEAMSALRARTPHVSWMQASPGRAVQMNAGARAASTRWLLFLHADARPPAGWRDVIAAADEASDVVAGSFRFALDSRATAARIIEWGVRLRVRWLDLPYGDQGIFVRRDVFEAMGGYREIPIMEDLDLMRRVRGRGRLLHADEPALVSPRRWERDGWLRRSVENVVLAVLFGCGVSPDRLARRYYPSEPPSPESGSHGNIAGGAWHGDRRVDRAARSATQTHQRAAAASRERSDPVVAVVMPALDEEEAIGLVLREIPPAVAIVTVADNGSSDRTPEIARTMGARVVVEPRRGYGRACLAGMRATPEADIVVFLDADRSDYPEDLDRLVAPVRRGEADLVLGARGGAMRPLHARLGTGLLVWTINRLWGSSYRDLGPFRAIARPALERLRMQDETWGWTIEMQVKAVETGLRVREIPVRQRDRVGRSKISGTLRGTVRAAVRMFAVIVKLWWTRRARLAAFGAARV